MKKLLVSITVFSLILMMMSGVVFAVDSGKIIEVPDLKIVIDGKLASFTDVPISVAQYNLLPVRELAVKLGVPDDNEHIIYNQKEKSVTIYKGQTKIYLVLGEKTAYVNDKPVTINVAPAGYDKNQRIYIPLAFVSQVLGKKVIWYGPTRTVLLCDEANYNNIKEILDKSNEAMKLVARYRMALDMDCIAGMEQISMNINMDVGSKVDVQQKKMFMEMVFDMFGMQIKTSSYYSDNASYTQDPFSQSWQKQTYIPAEYDLLFANQSNTNMLEYDEPFYAGLNQVISENPGEILLKGDIVLTELLQKAMDSQKDNILTPEDDLDFNSFNVEISLNAETYLINNIVINAKSVESGVDGKVETIIAMKILYSDYNGEIQIVVPEDIIKNAVEEQNTVE